MMFANREKRDRTGLDRALETGPYFENLQNYAKLTKNTLKKAKTLTINHQMYPEV